MSSVSRPRPCSVRNLIWNHFVKKDNGTVATCNYCKKDISFKSTTGNLTNNLKRLHVNIYLGLNASTSTEQISSVSIQEPSTGSNIDFPSTSQPTISELSVVQPHAQIKRQKTISSYIPKN